jgi:hypothetical protein
MISQSNEIEKLCEALAKAQSEFPQIEKNQEVEVKKDNKLLYKFKYADLTEIVNKTRPALSKHGISYTQTMGIVDGLGFCFYTQLMCQGQWMKTGFIPANFRENMIMKDIAGLATYGKRLSLSEALGVAADDDLDAPDEKGEITTPVKADSKPKTTPQNNSGYKPKTNTSTPPLMSEDQSEQIANLMEKLNVSGQDIEKALKSLNVNPQKVPADVAIKIIESLENSFDSDSFLAKFEKSDLNDPGDFVVNFGKETKGKKIKEIGESTLKAMGKWVDEQLSIVPPVQNAPDLFNFKVKLQAFFKSVGVQ